MVLRTSVWVCLICFCDLYIANKINTHANSPHTDFATVINESTGEIMEFQRVAFERNPSNTVYDECYAVAQCRQPLVTLSKIGNPELETRFPEMVDFLNGFTMDATDVNEILAYESELEQIATNQLKPNESLTNDQITQIWFVFFFSFFFCVCCFLLFLTVTYYNRLY